MDAVSAGFKLGYHIVKQVADNASRNAQDVYNNRKDLGKLKTYFVGPALCLMQASKFFNTKQVVSLNYFVPLMKGVADAVDTLPKIVYWAIQTFRGKAGDLWESRQGAGFIANFFANAAPAVKFCKDFSSGFTWVNNQVKTNLPNLAPKALGVASFFIRDDLTAVIAAFNAYQNFKSLTTDSMQQTIATLRQSNIVNLNRQQKQQLSPIGESLLKGVFNASMAMLCLSRIFKTQFDKNRYLGFVGLVATISYTGSGILTDRWKFMCA